MILVLLQLLGTAKSAVNLWLSVGDVSKVNEPSKTEWE